MDKLEKKLVRKQRAIYWVILGTAFLVLLAIILTGIIANNTNNKALSNMISPLAIYAVVGFLMVLVISIWGLVTAKSKVKKVIDSDEFKQLEHDYKQKENQEDRLNEIYSIKEQADNKNMGKRIIIIIIIIIVSFIIAFCLLQINNNNIFWYTLLGKIGYYFLRVGCPIILGTLLLIKWIVTRGKRKRMNTIDDFIAGHYYQYFYSKRHKLEKFTEDELLDLPVFKYGNYILEKEQELIYKNHFYYNEVRITIKDTVNASSVFNGSIFRIKNPYFQANAYIRNKRCKDYHLQPSMYNNYSVNQAEFNDKYEILVDQASESTFSSCFNNIIAKKIEKLDKELKNVNFLFDKDWLVLLLPNYKVFKVGQWDDEQVIMNTQKSILELERIYNIWRFILFDKRMPENILKSNYKHNNGTFDIKGGSMLTKEILRYFVAPQDIEKYDNCQDNEINCNNCAQLFNEDSNYKFLDDYLGPGLKVYEMFIALNRDEVNKSTMHLLVANEHFNKFDLYVELTDFSEEKGTWDKVCWNSQTFNSACLLEEKIREVLKRESIKNGEGIEIKPLHKVSKLCTAELKSLISEEDGKYKLNIPMDEDIILGDQEY